MGNAQDGEQEILLVHGDQEILLVHDPNELTPEDKAAVAAISLAIIIVTMIIGQAVLFVWKKYHKRSYELATLIGLWLIPGVFSIKSHYWRFIIIWTIYTLITGYICCLCVSKNLSSMTPRRVYTWFFTVYRISVVIGLCGYILLLAEFFGMAEVFFALGMGGTPIILLWYGLYFGILGRDCAAVASDWMHSGVMGGRVQLIVQVNRCGICQKELSDPSGNSVEGKTEKTITLNCKHAFHEFCIRGWTLIGKKDTCPSCFEKVDLKELYAGRPWETSNLTWIKMLDTLRYLIVWNPLIFLSLHFVLKLMSNQSETVHPEQGISMVDIALDE